MVVRKKGGFYHQDYFIIQMCISVWPDENFGFHELTEFKNLTGMIWVMFHFFLNILRCHLQLAFETLREYRTCDLFLCHQSRNVFTCFFTVFEHFFDKNPLLPISVRTWFESKSTSAHILMHFYFDVHCFIFILSAGRGVSLICIGNVRTKLSRIAFSKHQ